MVVRASDHLFAFSFGGGRYLLRDDRLERDFGLRIVLNSVDPESLRSVDVRTLDADDPITRAYLEELDRVQAATAKGS